MDCVPRCVAGGHLLVCVKVSVMVDIAVMAVLAMPMRGIAVRFEGHEGIDRIVLAGPSIWGSSPTFTLLILRHRPVRSPK